MNAPGLSRPRRMRRPFMTAPPIPVPAPRALTASARGAYNTAPDAAPGWLGAGARPRPGKERPPTPRTDKYADLSAESRPERAWLIAVDMERDDALWDVEDSLAELAALARTAGAEVVGALS